MCHVRYYKHVELKTTIVEPQTKHQHKNCWVIGCTGKFIVIFNYVGVGSTQLMTAPSTCLTTSVMICLERVTNKTTFSLSQIKAACSMFRGGQDQFVDIVLSSSSFVFSKATDSTVPLWTCRFYPSSSSDTNLSISVSNACNQLVSSTKTTQYLTDEEDLDGQRSVLQEDLS